jgi:hypothetical protein
MVYGLPLKGGRPRLPPTHPDQDQEKALIYDAMVFTACELSPYQAVLLIYPRMTVFQGCRTFPQWTEIDADRVADGELWLSRQRFPDGLPPLSTFHSWDPEPIRVLGDYMRDHQQRLDMGDVSAKRSAFQWEVIWDEAGKVTGADTEFRTEVHPDLPLQYPDSSYWYLRAVQEGLVPTLQDLSLFPQESLSIIKVQVRNLEFDMEVVDLLQRYHELNAPKVSH